MEISVFMDRAVEKIVQNTTQTFAMGVLVKTFIPVLFFVVKAVNIIPHPVLIILQESVSR